MFKRSLFRLWVLFCLLTGPVTVPVLTAIAILIEERYFRKTRFVFRELYSRNAFKALKKGDVI